MPVPVPQPSVAPHTAAHLLSERFRERTNGLHWCVVALYFSMAFLEAFPMIAFGNWIQNELKMSYAEQNTFYASIFIPWTLKPLYGWISERLPIGGLRRKPYMIICAFASASSWILLSHFVRTKEGAYGITMLRTMANAFAELLLGLMLVDTAGKNMANAGSIQASATGARATASLLALLVGLPMYPCQGHQPTFNDRTILLLNGLIGLLAANLTFWLPDRPVSESHATVAKSLKPMLVANPQRQPLLAPASDAATRRGFPALELCVPSILLFLGWAASKDLLTYDHWIDFLYAVIGVNLTVAALVAWKVRGSASNLQATLAGLGVVWPAVVFFLIYAMPSAEDTLESFQYTVWNGHQCYIQGLQIAGSVTALTLSWVYFFALHSWSGLRLLRAFALSSLLCSLTSLLWWPWVENRIVDSSGVPSFGYALLVTVVATACSQIMLVSGLVIATQACPVDDRTGFAYALYISFMDVGDTVSGWVTSPIVKSLQISAGNTARLPELLFIDVGTSLGALGAVPLLRYALASPGSSSLQRPGAHPSQDGDGDGDGDGTLLEEGITGHSDPTHSTPVDRTVN